MIAAPSRRRLEWPVGDKGGARFDWARRCAKYCRLKKRPKAASLVTVIGNYLSAEHGYAWATNDQLRIDMGDKHASAVERAIPQLDEMGVIERQTVTRHDELGRVSKSRRIFPCWPSDLDETLDGIRSSKVAPNRASKRQSASKPTTSPKAGNRPEGVIQTEPRPHERRTLNRTPSHSGNKEDTLCLQDKNSVRGDHHISRVGDRAKPIIDALAFIGPSNRDTHSEAAELIRIGRSAWVAINERKISETDTSTLLDQLRDAAIRAWLEHRPDVQGMLGHIAHLVEAGTARPALANRAIAYSHAEERRERT